MLRSCLRYPRRPDGRCGGSDGDGHNLADRDGHLANLKKQEEKGESKKRRDPPPLVNPSPVR